MSFVGAKLVHFDYSTLKMGRFFRTDGKYLGRAYKEHLSGFDDWEQKRYGEHVLEIQRRTSAWYTWPMFGDS